MVNFALLKYLTANSIAAIKETEIQSSSITVVLRFNNALCNFADFDNINKGQKLSKIPVVRTEYLNTLLRGKCCVFKCIDDTQVIPINLTLPSLNCRNVHS